MYFSALNTEMVLSTHMPKSQWLICHLLDCIVSFLMKPPTWIFSRELSKLIQGHSLLPGEVPLQGFIALLYWTLYQTCLSRIVIIHRELWHMFVCLFIYSISKSSNRMFWRNPQVFSFHGMQINSTTTKL